MKSCAIFGGTTEGRKLAEAFAGAALPLDVFVASEYGGSLLPKAENIHAHVGRLPAEEIESFLAANAPAICIDATHPYACVITEGLREACAKTGVPYLRVRRGGELLGKEHEAAMSATPAASNQVEVNPTEVAATANEVAAASRVVTVASAAEAVQFLDQTEGNILVTTGSKEAHLLTGIRNYKERCFVRVLPAMRSLSLCEEIGLSGQHIIAMQGPFSEAINLAMMEDLDIAWMLTKDSGEEGGCPEKVSAARKAGANILMIGRPEEPADAVSLEEAIAKLSEMFGCEARWTAVENDMFANRANSAEAEFAGKIEQITEGTSAVMDSIAVNRKNEEVRDAADNAHHEIGLIGMGPGRDGLLTVEALDWILTSDLLIGARRMLDNALAIRRKHGLDASSTPATFENSYAAKIADYMKEHDDFHRAALLYSGDISRYSGAKKIPALLPASWQVRQLSGISSVAYFLGKLGVAEEDTKVVSIHGRSLDLVPIIKMHSNVLSLIGESTAVADIAERLVKAGLSDVKITVGTDLSYTVENEEGRTETIISGTPDFFIGKEVGKLSLVLFENPNPIAVSAGFGLTDDEFIRAKVPMTKREIRTISLSHLGLHEDDIVYDIGAGTGSISIEAALHVPYGKVYAIERKEDAVELIGQNRDKFGLSNLEVVAGLAPEAMEGLPACDAAFVGGSSGNLLQIIETVYAGNPNARIVINSVTAETDAELEKVRAAYPERSFEKLEVMVIRERAAGRYHLKTPDSPITIVTMI